MKDFVFNLMVFALGVVSGIGLSYFGVVKYALDYANVLGVVG